LQNRAEIKNAVILRKKILLSKPAKSIAAGDVAGSTAVRCRKSGKQDLKSGYNKEKI